MATSLGKVYLEGCNYELAYDLLSQSTENNTSTVRLYGILNVTNNYVSWSSGSASVHTSGLQPIGTYYSKGSHTVITRDFTFQHDASGNFSAGIGASLSTTFVSGSCGGTLTLPKIDRYATITEVPASINDESQIWFKYDNPLNLTMYSWIEINPNGTHLATRTITNAGTSGTYTYTLTSAERNQITSQLPNTNNGTIRIGIYSSIGGVEYASYIDKPFTIINANPTMTYTITEKNTKVSALLGTTASTIVQNASILNFNVSPTAKKNATIKKVLCGNRYDVTNRKSKTSSPYSMDIPVKSENTFMVVVDDSRDNETNDLNIQKTMLAYTPIAISSLSFKRQNPTSSNIILNLTATYYQQTFGSTANTPTVKWKLGSGSWTTLTSSQYTINNTNHTLKVNNLILSNVLDYTSEGTFTLQISDKLTSAQDSRKVIRGIPTFEAGATDFQVNGDLYIADTRGENKRKATTVWTLLGTKTGTSSLTLPSAFDELLVCVHLGGNAGIETVVIPKNALSSSEMTPFTGGYYMLSDQTAYFSIYASTQTIQLFRAYLNGSVITSSTSYDVYYR